MSAIFFNFVDFVKVIRISKSWFSLIFKYYVISVLAAHVIRNMNVLLNNTLNNSEAVFPSAQKDVLKSFSKFKGKHLCWDLFLNDTQMLPCEFCEICQRSLYRIHSGDCFWLFSLKFVDVFPVKFWFLVIYKSTSSCGWSEKISVLKILGRLHQKWSWWMHCFQNQNFGGLCRKIF